eukprot:gene2655-8105_t
MPNSAPNPPSMSSDAVVPLSTANCVSRISDTTSSAPKKTLDQRNQGRRVSFSDTSSVQLFLRGISASAVPSPATSIPIGLWKPFCDKDVCSGCIACTKQVCTKQDDGEVYASILTAKRRARVVKEQGLTLPKCLLTQNNTIASQRNNVFCNCKGGICKPESCLCAKAGIGCHIQPEGLSCPCSHGVCNNPEIPTYESNNLKIMKHISKYVPSVRRYIHQLQIQEQLRKKKLQKVKLRLAHRDSSISSKKSTKKKSKVKRAIQRFKMETIRREKAEADLVAAEAGSLHAVDRKLDKKSRTDSPAPAEDIQSRHDSFHGPCLTLMKEQPPSTSKTPQQQPRRKNNKKNKNKKRKSNKKSRMQNA